MTAITRRKIGLDMCALSFSATAPTDRSLSGPREDTPWDLRPIAPRRPPPVACSCAASPLHAHADQSADQDRQVDLAGHRLQHGEHPGRGYRRDDVAVTHGAEGGQAEVEQLLT